ncbi:MAG: MBL fold metallo-hydrolase [Eudoraea sp.]|nr:MBL fold metallo-hydrolase [Eudoraea sp.]
MKKTIVGVFCGLLALFGCKELSKKAENRTGMTGISEKSEQPRVLKIIPIEHATAVVEWGDITIYIDPVGGAAAFEEQRKADLILITDIHGDHLSVETLEELDNATAKIIVPPAVAEIIPKEFTPLIDVLNNGETKERLGILVEAVPMYNLREEALNFHPKGRGNGYIITLGQQRLYFSGDTEDIPEMRALENIDKAFICMNLPYTMTEESAAAAVLEFKPEQVYPYHYRGRPDVSDVGKFKALVNGGDPEIEVVQLDWYPEAAY